MAIINQHLGIPTSISNATRLGKKTSKASLLRITVSSERDKANIVRNSTKLRSINEVGYLKKPFITPDIRMGRKQSFAFQIKRNKSEWK